MKCSYCGREEVLPFKCQYCHGLFCAEHRLPENHNCPEIDRAIAHKTEPAPYEYKVTYTPSRSKLRLGFSPREIRDLVISALLVSGVGLSWLGTNIGLVGYEIIVGLVVIFTGSFILHEFAHKVMAQRHGLWAEFRLTIFGAIITLMSIVLPFKFIAPGAVMIAGSGGKDVIGKTSIVGPLTNLVLGSVSFAIALFAHWPWVLWPAFSAFFNAFIAVLNLIPFAILDGLKVFNWNKIWWALAFTASVVLTAGVFIQFSQYLAFF